MRLTLLVTTGPHKGRNFTFARHDTFLVGRSRQAHFRLPVKDRYCSRVHFLIEINPPSCRLVDMGSYNGTHVNGQKVATADLRHGDEIRAGHTILRVTVEPGGIDAETDEVADPAAQHADAAPVADHAPYDGSTLDDHQPYPGYEIVRELGRGGMGVVFEARRRVDGVSVALKVIIPAVAGTRAQLERFLREVSILHGLDHPNIVAFRDVGSAAGRLYFAMEYVPGRDAERLLKDQGPLPVPRAVGLVCQVLAGLSYAHARGFVHRDVKPSNVLVSEANGVDVVKMADFGLARVYQASQLSGLTVTGEVGGTPAFMPPEQITAYRDAKPPADQYSAAATLYNLLTGDYPYDLPGRGPLRYAKILNEPPAPILRRRPDLSGDLAAVIHRAMQRDPGRRFPGVAEFRKALEPFRAG
jgi:serine/threonine-protein kinase